MMWIYKEDNGKILYNYYNTLILIVNRIIKQYKLDPIQDGKMKLWINRLFENQILFVITAGPLCEGELVFRVMQLAGSTTLPSMP